VAAIIQPRADRHPSLEDIQLHCRNAIAGYKVPRQLHVVETIVRSPSGKPDYRWANGIVAEAPEETDAGGARTSADTGSPG
jgi:acyl-CoA synthetase (AMP-forming)/AMP-acid ligase II